MFVIILFQFEGDVRPLSVRSETTLRDVQKTLCKMFGQPFPESKCLLHVAGVKYEDFIEKPFEDIVADFTPCNIYFEPTDDPYFYDLEDHKGSKVALHEELGIEDADPGDCPVGQTPRRSAREHYDEIPAFSPLMQPTHADRASSELQQIS